jgi:hypothetical protein
MSSTVLHVMLHGLIALTPINDADGANRITALLVDARTEPPGYTLQCFAEHIPTLKVTPQTTAECRNAQCKVVGAQCECALSRQEVTLSIDPPLQLAKRRLNMRPQNSLPFDQQSAHDFSYVANLTQGPLGRELDPRFLDAIPPDALVARMSLPLENIETCSFSARQDEGNQLVHPLSFRKAGDLEKPGDGSQALAQEVMSLVTLPEQATVTVTISDFGGGNRHDLRLKRGDKGYKIELTNMRKVDLLPGDPCDDGIGRDFAFFYELVKDKPDWKDRLIPHIKYTRWKSSKDLDTDRCHPVKAPSSRPICPMASFN